MKKFKICMLGAFAVGKTSLVQQYVFSILSGKYQTTLGVKIDKKTMQINDQAIELILWDLAGEEETVQVRDTYFRGAAGAVLVADGTRAETLDTACQLQQRLFSQVGEVPTVFMVNKSDLENEWEIERARLAELDDAGGQVYETSAKEGSNVKRAFQALALQLLEGPAA